MLKTLRIILPILVALILVTFVWFSEYKSASVLAKINVETLIISIGSLLTVVLWAFSKFKTNAKTIQAKVEKEQKEISRDEHQRFVQRLDHELKNPLTAIQLGLENLKPQLSNEEGSLEDLQTQVKRLSQLTGDLRKLANFNEQELELGDVNIAELLAETVDLAYDIADQRNLQLNLPEAPWPVPNIHADRDLLQLALYNVIENAVKYSNDGDNIVVSASDNSKYVKIEISDTGIGIHPGDTQNVWEELFRGQNGRNRNGTGIGLSLVKRIIERHQGKIELDSKHEKGTRVIFSLPIK